MTAPEHIPDAGLLARPGKDALRAMLADAPFAELLRGSSPPVVVACAGPRAVWGTSQALEFFGAEDLKQLTTFLFGANASQLASLSVSLPPSAKPRLERLRFSSHATDGLLTCLVRRYASSSGGGLLGFAVLGLKPGGGDHLSDDATRRPVIDETAFAPETDTATAPIAPRQTLTEVTTALAARFADRGTPRFVWRTNARHELTAIGEEADALLGENDALAPGANLETFFAAKGCDPSGAARAALAGGKSWSGVTTFWPVRGGGARAPVKLGGAALFGPDRAFEGYRGYGIIQFDQLVEAALGPPASADAEGPSALETILPIELHAPTPAPANEDLGLAEAAPADIPEADIERQASNASIPLPHAEPDTPLRDAPISVSLTTPRVVPTAPGFVLLRKSAQLLPASEAGKNVVQLRPPAPPAQPTRPVLRAVPPSARPQVSPDETVSLSSGERHAFREIARALGARVQDEAAPERGPAAPVAPPPMRDLVPPAPSRRSAGTPDDAAPDFENESLRRNARQLFDRLPVGIIVCRGEALIYVNRTQLDLLGFDSADAFFAAGGVNRMFRGRPPEALDPGVQGGTAPIIGADGEVMPVDARLQTIVWDGLPATLISFRRVAEPEATPRLRATELDLRQREAELREVNAILDTATDGVAVVDDQGRILSLNRSAQALFGYDQNEVAGEAFSLLFAQPSHALVQEYFERIKGGGAASALNDGREVIGRERQGGPIPLFLALGRVGHDGGGKFCAVLRDLTQFRRTERELGEARKQAEKASALKSDFLAKVSHEVRTPLNSILGFAEVMIDERLGPVGNDRYKGYLKDIHASGAHVLSLVNDLLDLSKIEAGKTDMKFAAVDANRIVSECVSLMQPQAAKVRVIMRLSLAPQLPSVVADERSLRQITLNLLSNAVKFTEPGGQVIVSTTLTESGNAVVRVKDTGIGMTEEEIGIALEPFRQISTSRKTRGTGLGLPLTKALIEANRASFSIKSRRNEGTLVEVIFPSTRVLAE